MTEPTIKMSKAALISLLQTRNEQLDAAEQTIKDISEVIDDEPSCFACDSIQTIIRSKS